MDSNHSSSHQLDEDGEAVFECEARPSPSPFIHEVTYTVLPIWGYMGYGDIWAHMEYMGKYMAIDGLIYGLWT